MSLDALKFNVAVLF